MSQLIELDAQEISPFEGEPQLLGVYHRGEGLRSMHKHDSDNRQRKKSGDRSSRPIFLFDVARA
ncbi:MAG: hypothetical protein II902_05515 [Selenomonadaceae bacterium]|nr:hypothetical protein [Selenomonadaceae bacterium]